MTKLYIGNTNLDEQVHALALSVLRKLDQEMDWIPGPSEPVAVLEKQPTRGKKKDTPKRNRSLNRTVASGAPRPSRHEGASARKKK